MNDAPDDGWIPDDDDDEPEPKDAGGIAPSVALSEIPGYLFIQDEKTRGEARRAFALGFVISDEGMFHPEWVTVWSQIERCLREGTFPEKPKIIKGGKRDNDGV